MHINQLHIGAFRGLADVDLQLAPVTLLCGPTGAGKTSVLEAVSLALRPTDPGQWISTAMRRDSNWNVVDAITSMFPLNRATPPSWTDTLHFHAKLGSTPETESTERRVQVTAHAYEAVTSLRLAVDVNGAESNIGFANQREPTLETTARLAASENKLFVYTIGPTIRRKAILDSVKWLLRQSSTNQTCVQRILNCVDPSIQDVRLQGMRVQLLQRQCWIDLAAAGEGLTRAFELALTVARASRGVLLIDGLENYVYHGLVPKLTATLISVAEALATQLIISTDSLDVIDATLTMNDEAGAAMPFLLHRLTRGPDGVEARSYDAEQVDQLRQGGLNLR